MRRKTAWVMAACAALAACDMPETGPQVLSFDGEVVEVAFVTPSQDVGALSEATGTAFAVARQTCASVSSGRVQMVDTLTERATQARFARRIFTFRCID